MLGNSGNDLRYNKCSVYHNTMLKTALPTSWRSNWRKPKPFQYIFLTNVHQQCQLERVPNALGARRRDLPRRDNFRNSNDVIFTRDITKSLADRCKSRLIIKMSKHSVRRKWRFSTFAKIISRRTTNLTSPNDSRVDFVLFCRWGRVSTTLLSRVIDDQNSDAITPLVELTQRDHRQVKNDVPMRHLAVYSVWCRREGERSRASRNFGVKFQTSISRKRLIKLDLSIYMVRFFD